MQIGIIGAGLNGLALGLALRRFGIDFEIFERSTELRSGGSGIYIWPQGIQVLAAIFRDKKFLNIGHTINALTTLTKDGGFIQSQPVSTPNQDYAAPACMFLRERLYEALLDEVGEYQVHANMGFARLAQNMDGVDVWYDNGEKRRFDVVIGADGIHSSVRTAIWPERSVLETGVFVSRGIVNFDHLKLSDEECQIFTGDQCRIVTYPTYRHTQERYWFAAYNSFGLDRPLDQTALLARFGDFPEYLRTMIAITPKEAVLESRLLELEPSDHWVNGRVALVGDAAHSQLPTIGYGLSLGLENCFVLAQSIACNCFSIERGLRRYERRAISRSNEIVSLTRRFTEIFYLEKQAVSNAILTELFGNFVRNSLVTPF